MHVERVTAVGDELVAAIARLVPQLSASRTPPSLAELQAIAAEENTHLLVARADNEVLGMLTLVMYRVPTGLRGWIHDVVVDENARGQGVAGALSVEALRVATEAGALTVHLTTRPARGAANRLYRRLGFEQYETNVYVWRPG
ncbi:MAG TPA: GNAT family N-acetyltransferase [Gaiellaceae bacterium]|nr:GNAT family N-acetyltransferase [Gaiellaceae bacterium]